MSPTTPSPTTVRRGLVPLRDVNERGKGASRPGKEIECSSLIKAPKRTGGDGTGGKGQGPWSAEQFSRKTSDRFPAPRVDPPWWCTVGAPVHSARTIGVCARFSDPGSISRQIEFFLKIKEHDIYLPISGVGKLRYRTLPSNLPWPRYRLTHGQEFVFLCETADRGSNSRRSGRMVLKKCQKGSRRIVYLPPAAIF